MSNQQALFEHEKRQLLWALTQAVSQGIRTLGKAYTKKQKRALDSALTKIDRIGDSLETI